MASTSKVTFNIDSLTTHSTLNIHVQQSCYLIYQTYQWTHYISLHVDMNNYNLL
jgi:hypothetical protein